jgi:hypothetical protein
VLFYPAVEACLTDQSEDELFLEISPYYQLSVQLRQIFSAVNLKKKATYVTALTRGQDCAESILKMVEQLYLQAVTINFQAVYPEGIVLIDLLLYQWKNDNCYWNEGRVSCKWYVIQYSMFPHYLTIFKRFRKSPYHGIFGSSVLEGNSLELTWRCVLHYRDVRPMD